LPEFTPKQLAAIDISRLGEDACIVAGPGSGKTTVLVERYRQLVEAGISPREILAITFTEKAAANMKDKMAKSFSAQPGLRRQIEAAYISTVHGFCQRLLKENAIAAGVDPQFSILDERQGQIRRARCVVETLDTFFRENPEETGRLMAAIDHPDLAVPLVEVYDAIRSAGVSIDSLFDTDLPDMGRMIDEMGEVIDDYRRFNGRMTANRLEYRDQLAVWPPMTELRSAGIVLPLASSGAPAASVPLAKPLAMSVRSSRAIATAPGTFNRPAPCCSRLAFPSGWAVYCRMALISGGVRPGFACSINATVPLTAGAAIDVPLRFISVSP